MPGTTCEVGAGIYDETTKVDDLSDSQAQLTTKVDQIRQDVRHEIGLAVEQIRGDIKAIPDRS